MTDSRSRQGERHHGSPSHGSPQQGNLRISQSYRLLLYVVGLGVWGTGLLWLVFHHWLQRPGEFGVQTHPLEPWWLRAHGGLGLAAVWLLGLLWGIHIQPAWPRGRRRWSGAVMTGAAIWLAVSGYLLYYVGDEVLRPMVSAAHWVSGLVIPGLYCWHRYRRRLGTSRATTTASMPIR